MTHNFPTRLALIFTVFFSCVSYGQEDYIRIINTYMENHREEHGLVPDDIDHLQIIDHYYTKSMDVVHVYAQQQVNGIPIYNAIGNFAIHKDEVIYFANNFESHIKSRTSSVSTRLSPLQAVKNAARQLGLGPVEASKPTSSKNARYLFSKSGISQHPIPVKLVYQPINEKGIRLAWDLSILTVDGEHWWSVRVDAQTGKIIDKNDWAVNCTFSKNQEFFFQTIDNSTSPLPGFGRAKRALVGDGSQYEVFALPVESPNFGNRTIVSEPAESNASPYGWHDIDGSPGAEYTITRGNNVYAYEDRDGNQNPGSSPDGGMGLDFVFPLNLNQSPAGYTDASTTNLFYINNTMHDIMYQYGFDEASGNFQEMNYTGQGIGGDPVRALSQVSADIGTGNNAIFMTPPDGISPIMRMYTWISPGGLLQVNGSGPEAGYYYGIPANFGPGYPTVSPITADLALVQDDNSGNSTDPYDACDNITNGSSLTGKIAVIKKSQCSFVSQVQKAQAEGALAVLMVNNVPGPPIAMNGTSSAINIPSIMIVQAAGTNLINSLVAGNTINATLNLTNPYPKDGGLDNGVMVHEYGHGVSARLTGGAGCLSNAEQMGEGWSDFFAMVLTMEPGDDATAPRGMSTYLRSQGPDGPGMRQYPYSTDMSINPLTYGDVQYQYHYVQGQQVPLVHGVGTIWASMLWDLTWALVDKYGFDPDVYHGTGGNNKALQLVIDGLKLQACSPGFVDGRDAILAADMALTDGANQCLIWSVFANRGLGWGADQGSTNSIFDQTEAFDMPPTSELDCSNFGAAEFGLDNFRIYPNPANQYVYIVSRELDENAHVSLFDINGRRVLNQPLAPHTRVDISGLSSGVYVIKVISREQVKTHKLIVR